MAALTLGLIFAGANPFDSAPVDAITVDIVSPNEVETGLSKPEAAPTSAPETEPSFEPPAPKPQPPPPSTPQATPPADPRSTQQASAATQAGPSPPSSVPPLQPASESPQSAEPQERNTADVFAMSLMMPDGRLGGSFDALATDKANIANDHITAFRNHLKTCSTLPAGVNKTDNVSAVVRIRLNPDGTLMAPPEPRLIVHASTGGGELSNSVIAALRKCQPYTMLPPDKYDEWKVLDLSFTPRNFGGG
jgi:hypothetical protein